MFRSTLIASLFALSTLLALAPGCASEGDEGTSGVDCGKHGTEHDGHCHCDTGYLFHDDTCLAAADVTELCEAEAETTTDADALEEHHHAACLCPETGDCPCHEGTLETLGAAVYCVPELHAEE